MKKCLLILVVVLSFYNSESGVSIDIWDIELFPHGIVRYNCRYYNNPKMSSDAVCKETIYEIPDRLKDLQMFVIEHMIKKGWVWMEITKDDSL